MVHAPSLDLGDGLLQSPSDYEDMIPTVTARYSSEVLGTLGLCAHVRVFTTFLRPHRVSHLCLQDRLG